MLKSPSASLSLRGSPWTAAAAGEFLMPTLSKGQPNKDIYNPAHLVSAFGLLCNYKHMPRVKHWRLTHTFIPNFSALAEKCPTTQESIFSRLAQPWAQLFTPSGCGAPQIPTVELIRPWSVSSGSFKMPHHTQMPRIKSGFQTIYDVAHRAHQPCLLKLDIY